MSLFTPRGIDVYGNALCDFNMASQHLHIFNPYGESRQLLRELEWPDGNDYVTAFLTASDPKTFIDQIDNLLGLPEQDGSLPPTTPPVLSSRLIAGLLKQRIFDRQFILIQLAWHDSSGLEGSFIDRNNLTAYPRVLAEMPGEDRPWEAQARQVARYWFVRRSEQSDSLALFDFTGKLHFPEEKKPVWDFWEEYKRNEHRIKPLVSQLEEVLEF